MATSTFHALLLEDEPLISMDLEMTLEAEGFHTSTLRSCTAASDWLTNHTPDLVIVDIELRDGVCADVVAHLVEARIPFVVHTGDRRSLYIGTPFERGTWVEKPAEPAELVRAARAAMGATIRVPRSPAGDAARGQLCPQRAVHKKALRNLGCLQRLMAMPRYFFDSLDGTILHHDRVGLEFASDDAARAAALLTLGELTEQYLPSMDDEQKLEMTVRDASGSFWCT